MTTTEHRHARQNPGVRESTLEMLARANARGRVAPPVGSKPYDPACRACNTGAPRRMDANGLRVAYPCSSCGAVRG